MTRIDIDFARAEGAVLRLVGLIERKGFEVRGLSLPAGEAGPARLSLDVAPRDAGRRVETLRRHVEKMYGVTAVTVAANEAAPPFLERAS